MGAGAEVGFYKHEGLGDVGDGRWEAVRDGSAPDMSLVLSDAGGEILSYDPDVSMPWVAAFDSRVQDPALSSLTADYSITFPDPDMYTAFRDSQEGLKLPWTTPTNSLTATLRYRRRGKDER